MADIKDPDQVILTTAKPQERLEAGDVGTVVHVYDDGSGYELEFTTLDGQTVAVVTVEASEVRPISDCEITHARTFAP